MEDTYFLHIIEMIFVFSMLVFAISYIANICAKISTDKPNPKTPISEIQPPPPIKKGYENQIDDLSDFIQLMHNRIPNSSKIEDYTYFEGLIQGYSIGKNPLQKKELDKLKDCVELQKQKIK